MRAGEESAEAVVVRKAVKAAGAKGRRTEEGDQPTDRETAGAKSRETHGERQLRQLPRAVGTAGHGGSMAGRATRRRVPDSRGRRWKKMPEGKSEGANGATLEAVLAPENIPWHVATAPAAAR